MKLECNKLLWHVVDRPNGLKMGKPWFPYQKYVLKVVCEDDGRGQGDFAFGHWMAGINAFKRVWY